MILITFVVKNDLNMLQKVCCVFRLFLNRKAEIRQ